ncbi:hypothetical protein MKX08_009080 [Trichoderma sp. CBMAI-0020]|nr:hypothetical protein MKX08_009080 [Trichoderma sp. CBMAI-0020]
MAFFLIPIQVVTLKWRHFSEAFNLVLNCMSQTVAQRKGRMVSKVATDGILERQKHDDIATNGYNNFPSVTQTEAEPQLGEPAPITSIFCVPRPATSGAAKGKQAVAPRASMKSLAATAQSSLKHKIQANSPNNDASQASDSDKDPAGFREKGVPNAIWKQLSQAKKAERSRQLQRKAEREHLIQKLRETMSDDHDQLRAKLIAIDEEIHDEVELQKCLQRMGLCPLGFQWTQVSGGYRCEGGTHFISDGELHKHLH